MARMEETMRAIHAVCVSLKKTVTQQAISMEKIHDELKQLKAQCKKKEIAEYSVKAAGLEV